MDSRVTRLNRIYIEDSNRAWWFRGLKKSNFLTLQNLGNNPRLLLSQAFRISFRVSSILSSSKVVPRFRLFFFFSCNGISNVWAIVLRNILSKNWFEKRHVWFFFFFSWSQEKRRQGQSSFLFFKRNRVILINIWIDAVE